MSSLNTCLEQWFKMTSLQKGRDKPYRAVQYFLKYVAWQLKENDTAGNAESIKLAKGVSSIISMSRKFGRLGKWLESIKKFADMLSNEKEDQSIKYVTILNEVTNFFYYWYDMLQWLHFAQVYTIDKKAVGDSRCKWWCVRMISHVLLNALKLNKLNRKIAKAKKDGNNKSAAALALGKGKLYREMFRGSLDFLVPANKLGYTSLHDGHIGLTGALSSVVGGYDVWIKSAPK